jgi:hypothetical protein
LGSIFFLGSFTANVFVFASIFPDIGTATVLAVVFFNCFVTCAVVYTGKIICSYFIRYVYNYICAYINCSSCKIGDWSQKSFAT